MYKASQILTPSSYRWWTFLSWNIQSKRNTSCFWPWWQNEASPRGCHIYAPGPLRWGNWTAIMLYNCIDVFVICLQFEKEWEYCVNPILSDGHLKSPLQLHNNVITLCPDGWQRLPKNHTPTAFHLLVCLASIYSFKNVPFHPIFLFQIEESSAVKYGRLDWFLPFNDLWLCTQLNRNTLHPLSYLKGKAIKNKDTK